MVQRRQMPRATARHLRICAAVGAAWICVAGGAPPTLAQSNDKNSTKVLAPQVSETLSKNFPGLDINTPDQSDRIRVLCSRFSDLAVQWTTEAGKFNCSVSGPQWSMDPDHYFQRCLNIGKETRINALLAAQQVVVEACQAAKPDQASGPMAKPDKQTCFLYAKQALDQVQTAQSLRCGFSGQRWVRDFAAHRQRCAVQMTVGELSRETQARNASLVKCRSN